MKPRRRDADHEAASITINADEIDKPHKMYRNGHHNGNRTKARGNVVVTVNKRHPESKNDDFRPWESSELYGTKDQEITIEAMRIQKHGRFNNRDSASASKDVRIFGKLKRIFSSMKRI